MRSIARSKSSSIDVTPSVLIRTWSWVQIGVVPFRAGHVPTFLKSFRSVLERGPSARSFRSRSFIFNRFVLVPFHPVPFRSEQKNGHPFPFRSWRSQSKNGSIPLVLFLVKNVFIPRSVLSKERFMSGIFLFNKSLKVSKTMG